MRSRGYDITVVVTPDADPARTFLPNDRGSPSTVSHSLQKHVKLSTRKTMSKQGGQTIVEIVCVYLRHANTLYIPSCTRSSPRDTRILATAYL